MPVITLLTGKIDFSNLFIALDGGSYKTLVEEQIAGRLRLESKDDKSMKIGFKTIYRWIYKNIIVKGNINKLRRKEEPAPATTKICPHCKSEVHIGAKRKSYYNN